MSILGIDPSVDGNLSEVGEMGSVSRRAHLQNFGDPIPISHPPVSAPLRVTWWCQ